MTFHINHKAYTVDIGEDIDQKMELGIKKFLNLDKNIETTDLLMAYIKKTYELAELERSLETLSSKIDAKLS
ncbi:MAG: hypothetical protein PHF17_04075 [Arcobacteraceae bacterium]|jgi:hypothetical protein|nr:hypothetical protein [Arcobacteraceae bacterium]